MPRSKGQNSYEINHFHKIINMTTPWNNNLIPGSYKINNFGTLLFGYHINTI